MAMLRFRKDTVCPCGKMLMHPSTFAETGPCGTTVMVAKWSTHIGHEMPSMDCHCRRVCPGLGPRLANGISLPETPVIQKFCFGTVVHEASTHISVALRTAPQILGGFYPEDAHLGLDGFEWGCYIRLLCESVDATNCQLAVANFRARTWTCSTL